MAKQFGLRVSAVMECGRVATFVVNSECTDATKLSIHLFEAQRFSTPASFTRAWQGFSASPCSDVATITLVDKFTSARENTVLVL